MAELEISNFIGIQSSNVSPPKNACVVCDNFDVRGDRGALVTRTGYDRKYDRPNSRTIVSGDITVGGTTTTNIVTNITTTANQYVNAYLSSGGYERLITSHTTGANAVFTVSAFPSIPTGSFTIVLLGNREDLGMCNFYVPDNGGREITVLVQKGTLASERALDYQSPTSLNIVVIWVRPYWSGSAWVDSWLWLNQCIYTTINDIQSDKYKIELDFADSTLKTDGFNNWTLVHLGTSPKETAKIIKTYEGATSNQVAVKISKSSYSWQEADPSPPATAGDSVLIMRNYIPYDYLIGMYSSVVADISFHKILNDLRIGFGGQASRLGLAIGYRKKYWAFNSFNFGTGDTDLTGASAKEDFSKIDEIILTPYNSFGTIASLDLSIYTPGTGQLTGGTYYFRLTGVLDGYEEFLLSEQSIVAAQGDNIRTKPKVDFGSLNKRFTELRSWYSKDNIIFYLLDEYPISDDSYSYKNFVITADGFFSLDVTTTDLHTENDSVKASATDYDAEAAWAALGTNVSINSVTTDPTPGIGTYSLKALAATLEETEIGGMSYINANIKAKTLYNIKCKLISKNANTPITIYFGDGTIGGVSVNSRTVVIGTSWTDVDITLLTKDLPDNLHFTAIMSTDDWIAIDDFELAEVDASIENILSIVEENPTDAEMLNELGYSPTTNLALSWDQVVVTKKKSFMVSPYFIDGGRILNNIFYSPFSGDGEGQYDVITPGKFYPQDNFDGNDLIGLQVLSNSDFLGIRRNSVQWIDSDTGQSKEVRYGNGGVNNRGIVNFGEYVIYPGENDLVMVNPLRALDISEGTIRSDYRLLTKANIIATREEKDNAYRFFTGNTTTKQDFILTKRGWISAKRYLYPKAFTTAKDGTVWFLGSDGHVYYDDTVDGDNGAAISYNWRSIVFDQSLMGEGIKGDMRFYLQQLWFRYNFTVSPSAGFTVKLYLDGASGASYYQTFVIDASVKYFSMPIPPGASCRTFQIDISGTDAFGSTVIIYSLGIEYTVIPIGLYAKIP